MQGQRRAGFHEATRSERHMMVPKIETYTKATVNCVSNGDRMIVNMLIICKDEIFPKLDESRSVVAPRSNIARPTSKCCPLSNPQPPDRRQNGSQLIFGPLIICSSGIFAKCFEGAYERNNCSKSKMHFWVIY